MKFTMNVQDCNKVGNKNETVPPVANTAMKYEPMIKVYTTRVTNANGPM